MAKTATESLDTATPNTTSADAASADTADVPLTVIQPASLKPTDPTVVKVRVIHGRLRTHAPDIHGNIVEATLVEGDIARVSATEAALFVEAGTCEIVGPG